MACYLSTSCFKNHSIEEAIIPSVAKNIACRSRGMICVETASTVNPIFSATCAVRHGHKTRVSKAASAHVVELVASTHGARTGRDAAHWEFDWRHVPFLSGENGLGLQPDQCHLAAIRDEKYKYVHFPALPSLLFDLNEDGCPAF